MASMMLVVFLVFYRVGAVLGIHQFIDGEYLLGVNAEGNDALAEITWRNYDIELVKSWNMGQTKLFWAKGEESDVARFGKLPGVKFWERNMIFYAQQCNEQPSPQTWGLDRIDQVSGLPYFDPLDASATYNYGEHDGENVRAYIVDTGIQTDHVEFGDRAAWGFTSGGLNNGTDDNGHGTHVAGTVGAENYGVAKFATLIAVKVLDAQGVGTSVDIIDGLNWVLSDHTAAGNNAKSVVNLSFGAVGSDPAVETAVQALIDSGVTCCIAAGDDDADACGYTPARVSDAITVGASDINDTTAFFTNWGSCLDIFAPGVDIRSTYNDSDYQTMSGTSMAVPHVTGLVARYMSSEVTPPTPDQVASYLLRWASPDRLEYSDGHETSPNLLLWSGCPMP